MSKNDFSLSAIFSFKFLMQVVYITFIFFLFCFSQSTPTSYDNFTQETLTTAEAAKQKSINLRVTLNRIYAKSIKDLRDQATQVDIALAENVKLTQDCLRQLEVELLRVRI